MDQPSGRPTITIDRQWRKRPTTINCSWVGRLLRRISAANVISALIAIRRQKRSAKVFLSDLHSCFRRAPDLRIERMNLIQRKKNGKKREVIALLAKEEISSGPRAVDYDDIYFHFIGNCDRQQTQCDVISACVSFGAMLISIYKSIHAWNEFESVQ